MPLPRVRPAASAALLATVCLASCESASAPEARVLDRLELSGPSAPVLAGLNVQFYAVAFDTKNRQMNDPVIAWASSNPAVAPVDAFGFVMTKRPGAATITATSTGTAGERSDTASITVIGTPCHQWPTLGASTTASATVAGAVAGTDCLFAQGQPSKGHAFTLAAPTTVRVEVQGAGFVPIVAVARSDWGIMYNAVTGTVPGAPLSSVYSLPAGDFVIWVASAGQTNASYTLVTSAPTTCLNATLARTLAPGDSIVAAIGPASCWRNYIVQMEGWRVIAAPDEEIVIDVSSAGALPTAQFFSSDNVVSGSAVGGATVTLGRVPATTDTLALWISLQGNTHAPFTVRRRISQLPTCLTPTDTLAVGDTTQRLMYYGDCERGSTGVRMHTFHLALDSASNLDLRMATGFFRPGFAVRTPLGAPLYIAQVDETGQAARLRVTLPAGRYIVTASSPFAGAIGLYTLSMIADAPP